MTKPDISSPADVTKLIKTFYDKLLSSSVKHHFEGLDLEEHLPHIERFWNTMLFPDYSYASNIVEKHTRLSLQKEDFSIWLKHFTETVDEFFSGPNAQMIKNRASGISYIMQKKLLKD
jgi:hemoglobin